MTAIVCLKMRKAIPKDLERSDQWDGFFIMKKVVTAFGISLNFSRPELDNLNFPHEFVLSCYYTVLLNGQFLPLIQAVHSRDHRPLYDQKMLVFRS
ncbi:hypothetical protein D3C73_1460640 [compost metagenome]